MQRTDWTTLRERFVGSIGTGASFVGHYMNKGIDLGVHFIDSSKMCINHFPTGKLFTANTFSKV